MIDIDKLNAETILDDGVFREIFETEDEFEKAKLVIALTEKAGELRVKGKFDTLLKAFKKEFAKKQKETQQLPEQPTYNRMTEFNSPKHDEMQCGGWICDSDGVRIVNNEGVELVVCHHPIFPVQRLISIDTDKEKVKLAYKDRSKWREIIVDKRTIADVNKIISLVDFSIDVNSNNAKALMQYLTDILNLNMDTIDTQMCTSKLGWVNGEFIPYCKSIVFDGEQKFKELYESIEEVGDETTWMDFAKATRKSDRFEPKITLIASLASVLIEPLNALPFIVNIWGDTGRGKTLSSMFATSVWANPEEGVYMSDAKSTATALELRQDVLNNLPLFIDDMSQVKRKYDGDFSELVYMLCSGKGKDRANTSLGLNRSTTWKNTIITNYEYSLITETMQGGAVNRIIDVECADGYIFENGNEVAELLRRNYGFAGKKFIDVIKQLGLPEIRKFQRQAYDAIIKKAKEKGVEKEEKQILPMSVIWTADLIATKYIFQDGQYLDYDYCIDLLKNKNEVSENERAYEFIKSEIAINMAKFVPSDPVHGTYKGDIWGCLDGGYAYIIGNIFEQMCKRGNFSSKSFLSWAKKRDLLDCSDGRLKKQKRIGSAKPYCVCLKYPDSVDDEDSTLEPDENGFVEVTEQMQAELPFMV